jgi:hypothetical protein
MKRPQFLILIALVFWSMPSNAEDCVVKTDVRPLMTGMPALQEEKIIVAEGRYTSGAANKRKKFETTFVKYRRDSR